MNGNRFNVEAPGAMTIAARVDFGIGGTAEAACVAGFSAPEDGFTWALGPKAVLRVIVAPGDGDVLLQLHIRPFLHPPLLQRQHIGVAVEGHAVGAEWVAEETVLGFRVPAALVANKRDVEIALTLPQAASPAACGDGNDTRVLGAALRTLCLFRIASEPPFAVRRLAPLPWAETDGAGRLAELARFCTGLPLADLMLHFESLGENCELGMVQRACGAEPQGLLRFTSIFQYRLIEGLDAAFEGVDDPALVHAYRGPGEDPEWLLCNDRYGMHAHSFQLVSGIDAAACVAAQVRRARLQRRRLLDVLRGGENLFVVQRRDGLAEAHLLPLLAALRRYGPNALLVVQMDPAMPSGSAEQIGPDLFRGYIDSLAPLDDVGSFHLPPWVSICANAYRLWRESGHGG